MKKAKVDFDDLKERLLERRDEILGQLHHVKEAAVFNPSGNPLDSAEEAAELLDQDMVASVNNAWSRELVEIDTALARIEERNYGTCSDCNGTIAPQRLQALPSASLCLNCQEERESAERNSSSAPRMWRHISEKDVARAYRMVAEAC